jgi:exopolyphosphatase/guanosine-5'-triphosphate,3'-diphosphate pyrophosphatase
MSVYKPAKVFVYATSAIRSAKNGSAFVQAAKARAGIQVRVISGDQEAELIYYGVRQCVRMDSGLSLIMDIGGGSTEFIIADGRKIRWKKSFDIGASRLLEKIKPGDPITIPQIKKLERHLGRVLKPLDIALQKYPAKKLIGSSGSFDTFAEMIGWKYYGRNVLKNVHAYDFNMEDFFRLHQILLRSTTASRRRMKGLIKMRVDMIVLASICTQFIIRRYQLGSLTVSKYALKEGALWKVVHG